MALPLPIDKMLLKNYEDDIKQISTGNSNYITLHLTAARLAQSVERLTQRQSGRSRFIIPGAGPILRVLI